MYSLLHILLFSSFSASAEQVPSRDISFLSGKKGFLDLIIIGRRLLFCPDWQWQQCWVARDKICGSHCSPQENFKKGQESRQPFFASSCFVCIHFTQLLFLNKLYNVRPSLRPNVGIVSSVYEYLTWIFLAATRQILH